MQDSIARLSGGHRIAFVLISIVLLNLASPFSETSTVAALAFVGVYLVLTASAIYLVSGERNLTILTVLLSAIIAVAGGITIASGFNAALWIQASWHLALVGQVTLIAALLALFIIESSAVNREVLFAAIAIYFLLAGLFTSLYVLIDIFVPGAFVSSSGAPIAWQRLNYFSLVTMSTLGYGDIIPVAPAAQSLSAMQGSLGMLYVAILIGRFVSLYRTEPRRGKEEATGDADSVPGDRVR